MPSTRGILAGVIALAVGACNALTDPVPTWYGTGLGYGLFNGVLLLHVYPEYLTLETRLPPGQVVLQALQCAPEVCRTLPYYARPFHYYVKLPPGSTVVQAEHAARTLRHTPGVDFASAVYQGSDSTCEFVFYNLLIVQFKSGTALDTITRINAIAGTRIDPDYQTYSTSVPLLYPAGGAHSPVEIAAYYGHHPKVEWVSPGTTGCTDGHVYSPFATTR